MTRILQISDTHIVARGALANGVVDTAAALRCAVETIAAQEPWIGPIDLVLFTGDLTDHGRPEEYAEFRRLVEPLGVTLVAVPGNHDERGEMRRAFADAPWMPGPGPINVRVDLADVTVLGLDTLVDGASYGALSAETVEWLAVQLKELDARPLLIGLHHPPFETGIALMDRQGLRNAADLGAVLQSYQGPIRIAAGHVHRMVATAFAGQPAMICPGTSHAVALDLGAVANNHLMVEPPGMLLHDFGAVPRTHLIPLGQFDGPFPFLP